MKLMKASVYLLRWPFKLAVRHSLASNQATCNVLVELTDEDGRHGYGEGVPRQYVTGETIDITLAELEKTFLPPLMGINIQEDDIGQAMTGLFTHEAMDAAPSAACAVETALWDLAGKISGKSVVDFLGGAEKNDLTYSGIIPLSSPEKMPELTNIIRALGLTEIKLKVGTPHDLESAAIIRRELGPDIRLRVDANGAWSATEAVDMIQRLSAFDIKAVEQPVARNDVDGMAFVRSRVDPLILADESLCTFSQAEQLVRKQAVDGFNLRLSKCGGFSRTKDLFDMARRENLVCMMGCQVGELGILSAAGRHFAAANSDLIHLEGSLTHLLVGRDVISEDISFGPGGKAAPLTGPGLGVNVLPDALTGSLLYSRSA